MGECLHEAARERRWRSSWAEGRTFWEVCLDRVQAAAEMRARKAQWQRDVTKGIAKEVVGWKAAGARLLCRVREEAQSGDAEAGTA